jgi:hypothetical protein
MSVMMRSLLDGIGHFVSKSYCTRLEGKTNAKLHCAPSGIELATEQPTYVLFDSR